MKEFKVNEYITLKLEGTITFVYIKDEKFRQCMRLVLHIPKIDVEAYDDINSIDEASERFKTLHENRIIEGGDSYNISAEQEFFGHCSNIQTWAENDYATHLLHSNLSFPLLRKLSEVGDPIAKRIFKDEIIRRFEEGNAKVLEFLIQEGYLEYFLNEEIETLFDKTPKSFFTEFRGAILLPNEASILAEMEKEFKNDKFFLVDSIASHTDLMKFPIDSSLSDGFWDVPFQFVVKNKQVVEIALTDLNNCRNCEDGIYQSDENEPGEADICYNCGIRDIPVSMGNLTALKKVYITANDFFSNDFNLKNLANLSNLEVLYLHGCCSTDFSSIVKNFKSLKVLVINYYSFDIFPEGIMEPNNLETLNLCRTWIKNIPKSISNLKILKHLILDDNSISTFPPEITKLHNLEILSLIENSYDLKTYPELLCQIKSLRKLYLDENRIEIIPYDISKLNNLEILSLNDNKIASLPESIGNLRKLRKLNIKNNKIKTLPESMINLISLEKLNIEGNIISDIPKNLLENIIRKNLLSEKDSIHLKLEKKQAKILNKIEELIDGKLKLVERMGRRFGGGLSLGPLSNEYKIEDNKVIALCVSSSTAILEDIGELSSLKHLKWEGNFTVLPESITKLNSLEILELSKNSFDPRAKSLLEQLKNKEVRINYH